MNNNSQEDHRVKLFVLNNFTKFEKKVYQVFGLKLGRPVALNLLMYAFVFGVIEFIMHFIPVVSLLVSWMPFVLKIGVPIGLGWLLNDVGTEGRRPLSFFKSFFKYHVRSLIGNTYFRNREVQKNQEYQFKSYFTYKGAETEISNSEAEERKQAVEEQEKAMRYLHRIHDVEGYHQLKKEEKEKAMQERNNKNIWNKIIPFKLRKGNVKQKNKKLKKGA